MPQQGGESFPAVPRSAQSRGESMVCSLTWIMAQDVRLCWFQSCGPEFRDNDNDNDNDDDIGHNNCCRSVGGRMYPPTYATPRISPRGLTMRGNSQWHGTASRDLIRSCSAPPVHTFATPPFLLSKTSKSKCNVYSMIMCGAAFGHDDMVMVI